MNDQYSNNIQRLPFQNNQVVGMVGRTHIVKVQEGIKLNVARKKGRFNVLRQEASQPINSTPQNTPGIDTRGKVVETVTTTTDINNMQQKYVSIVDFTASQFAAAQHTVTGRTIEIFNNNQFTLSNMSQISFDQAPDSDVFEPTGLNLVEHEKIPAPSPLLPTSSLTSLFQPLQPPPSSLTKTKILPTTHLTNSVPMSTTSSPAYHQSRTPQSQHQGTASLPLPTLSPPPLAFPSACIQQKHREHQKHHYRHQQQQQQQPRRHQSYREQIQQKQCRPQRKMISSTCNNVSLPATHEYQTSYKSISACSAATSKETEIVKQNVEQVPYCDNAPDSSSAEDEKDGLGKFMYYFDKMKLEMTDTDRKVKDLQQELYSLRENNKHIEARNNDLQMKLNKEIELRKEAETELAKSIERRISSNDYKDISEINHSCIPSDTKIQTDNDVGKRRSSLSADFHKSITSSDGNGSVSCAPEQKLEEIMLKESSGQTFMSASSSITNETESSYSSEFSLPSGAVSNAVVPIYPAGKGLYFSGLEKIITTKKPRRGSSSRFRLLGPKISDSDTFAKTMPYRRRFRGGSATNTETQNSDSSARSVATMKEVSSYQGDLKKASLHQNYLTSAVNVTRKIMNRPVISRISATAFPQQFNSHQQQKIARRFSTNI